MELSAVMRSLETYKISAENRLRKSFNDLTASAEKRPRFYSTQNLSSSSSSSPYRNKSNFRRNYQKKRNSADIDRILAKYAYLRQPNSNTMPNSTPNKNDNKKSKDDKNKSKDFNEIKCVTVKEKEIGTKYSTTNMTDNDKIALRPKKNRYEKGSASQKFDKYHRRVKSVFIVGSEKELWKFKSSDNVSKVDVIPEEIDEMIARGESHSDLFEKCNVSVCSRNSVISPRNNLKSLIEEGEKFNTVPRRWKSQHFCEESILTRPASGVWEVPKSKTLFLNNSYDSHQNYFYAKIKKGESCASLNSTKKWWQTKFTIRKRMFDCWVKWRRRKVDSTDVERPSTLENESGSSS